MDIIHIEITRKQAKQLAKGKTIKTGKYEIAVGTTSYKELLEKQRSMIYNLRYQLKKLRNGSSKPKEAHEQAHV